MWYVEIIKRERNPKGQSGVDNPDTGNIGNKAPNADKQNTKTITTKHTTPKIKKMNNIEHPALTEHYRIWNITPSPSKLSVIFGVTDDTV